MNILLDTNIIIHREASKVINPNIGLLFYWIDRLKHVKVIHPVTVEELNRNIDSKTVETMNIKIKSYRLIRNEAPLTAEIKKVSAQIDTTANDLNDTKILNEIYANRIDILISEDKKIHAKAKLLSIDDRVFTIQKYLEKVISENPELVNYKVLAVKKVDFAQVDVNDKFFDSFREDYQEFNQWFDKKADEISYVCYDNNVISAFLYIKVEEKSEHYPTIQPGFCQKKRLKIGTLKVTNNGFKIGERFLKIIFDNALQYKVDEIYVTIFNKRPEQELLIEMLLEWGFVYHGIKSTQNGDEKVYIRPFGKKVPVNTEFPKFTYPFFSRDTDKYIIKIEPQYHTELFPDSINTREQPRHYTDNEPHRNRISKVYISHSKDRNLRSGDVIIIYRIGETDPKKYSSTVTTICIVENIIDNIQSFEDFLAICNRRTVISKQDLKTNFWDKYPNYRPFVINFLYAHSFPTPKPTLDDLNNLGIIPDIKNMPRGFIKLTTKQLNTLISFAYRK
ncbi:MAG TPA: PIN domain-containing protein [Mucilaginibacter sp.]|jgi:hypothetical protein